MKIQISQGSTNFKIELKKNFQKYSISLKFDYESMLMFLFHRVMNFLEMRETRMFTTRREANVQPMSQDRMFKIFKNIGISPKWVKIECSTSLNRRKFYQERKKTIHNFHWKANFNIEIPEWVEKDNSKYSISLKFFKESSFVKFASGDSFST